MRKSHIMKAEYAQLVIYNVYLSDWAIDISPKCSPGRSFNHVIRDRKWLAAKSTLTEGTPLREQPDRLPKDNLLIADAQLAPAACTVIRIPRVSKVFPCHHHHHDPVASSSAVCSLRTSSPTLPTSIGAVRLGTGEGACESLSGTTLSGRSGYDRPLACACTAADAEARGDVALLAGIEAEESAGESAGGVADRALAARLSGGRALGGAAAVGGADLSTATLVSVYLDMHGPPLIWPCCACPPPHEVQDAT